MSVATVAAAAIDVLAATSASRASDDVLSPAVSATVVSSGTEYDASAKLAVAPSACA